MIDSILKTLKQEVGGKILGETNLPTDKLDGVFNVVGESAKSEVVSQLSSGNLSSLTSLFSNNANSSGANQLQSNLQTSIVSGLIKKLGLSDGMANTISQIVVPALINLVTKKNSQTPDDDPSPITDIFGSITGDKGGLGGMVGNLFN